MGLRLLTLMVLCAGCDWASADGPWNAASSPDPADGLAEVSGVVCSPNGLRDVPGIEVSLRDASDEEAGTSVTDPWGRWSVELPPGRYVAEAGGRGSFRGFGVVLVQDDDPLDAGAICFERGTPQALLFRSAVAEGTDLLDQRIAGLGLDHVHDGPSDSASAAQILASPAGLVEYGIVALLGGLDFPALAAQPGALDGLRDHLEDGGGLFLSADAWPVLDALAPGAVLPVGLATGGYVLADVADAVLAEQLQWDTAGVPVPKDSQLLLAGEGAQPLLSALVPEGSEGEGTEADLLLRVAVGDGEVVISSFFAPAPRVDGWWMGDPEAFELPDGAWDGRGAVLDRVLLQL